MKTSERVSRFGQPAEFQAIRVCVELNIAFQFDKFGWIWAQFSYHIGGMKQSRSNSIQFHFFDFHKFWSCSQSRAGLQHRCEDYGVWESEEIEFNLSEKRGEKKKKFLDKKESNKILPERT